MAAHMLEQSIGVGSLVEIYGLDKPVRGKVVRLPDVDGNQAQYEDIDAEELQGKLGICSDLYEDPQMYVVRTFGNIIADIPREYVRESNLPDPIDGGFDLAWPADGAFNLSLASTISRVLAYKGYCMMQMFASELDALQMAQEAHEIPRQYRMKREIETAYLGLESTTKVALRPHDTPAVQVTDAISSCDRCLTNIAVKLGSLPFSEVGFQVKSRTNAFVRVPYANELEQGELGPESLSVIEEANNWDGDITSYVKFSQERTISMLHLVQNEGGQVFLYPRDAAGKESIQLPISPNKLLLFRHDWMDYSYQPLGKSLALQAWINRDRSNQQAIKEVEIDFKTGVATLNPGRALPEGIPAHVRGLHAKMPMDVENEWMWWAEFTAGTDGCSQWPSMRWPTEPYYLEGDEAMSQNKSYTKHGGFVSDKQIEEFDNAFFGINSTEARHMIPGQRWGLEVGYCVLMKCGFNKHNLEGLPIGIWVGDVGCDWHDAENYWPWGLPDMTQTEAAIATHSHITASRLPYHFGIRGPCSSYDTACSASLVALNAAHTFMMNDDDKTYSNMNMVMGWNALLWPVGFIANCAAGMLSHVGRCFTFNRAADGYQRGEGCGGVLLQRQCTKEEIERRQGAIIGTCTNQDGRSASITAPNGPSQTACIKKSMLFAGIDVNAVGMAECHGTGTALGDPIEIGALQAVMRVREQPIFKVSTKSHIGHLEAGAGIAGLTKCLQMIRFCTAPPNAHFNVINANLLTTGYPVHFTTEVSDTGYSAGYCGVSSFGFGGTNSRCDVYNRADRGPRKTVTVELPALALPMQVFDAGNAVSICGTWNNWEADRMDDYNGAKKYRVVLGATLVERFHLTTGDEDLALYPAVHKAGPSEQILGPDSNSNGREWIIDGIKDGMASGTVYEITFKNDGKGKRIWWVPVGMSKEDVSRTDIMFITGTFNNWALQPMQAMPDAPGTYKCQFQIGPRHIENFQFLINKDREQTIYPGENLTVCGPDNSGSESKFSVGGKQLQTATVKLRLREGRITVISHTDRQGYRTWGDTDAMSITTAHSYFLVSSADDFRGHHPMKRDLVNPTVFKGHITLVHSDGDTACESFQLNMNKDDNKTLFPSSSGAVQGPDTKKNKRCWAIRGSLGETYEITLDVNAPNRAHMIDWRLVQVE
mmetsp:Transcript_118714/g.218695  ORF Transcript_118714/g.218695 Transcript_118714/m.218695 type:complete len:1161 (+) Transcript_118714:37-3519(+)